MAQKEEAWGRRGCWFEHVTIRGPAEWEAVACVVSVVFLQKVKSSTAIQTRLGEPHHSGLTEPGVATGEEKDKITSQEHSDK